MAAVRGKAVVGQGGGPTCVINQSLVGIVQAAQKIDQIEEVLGAVHGVRGIKNEQFKPLKGLSKDVLEAVADTPSAALGSTRDKVDHAYAEAMFEVFKKNDVRYFFYIGGNDSADTAMKVNTFAEDEGYDIRVIHVPKTIDNDLTVTDHCPGYGSAARFVACAFMGNNLDNRSLPGIKINIVMGRNAGWLTAASALGKVYDDDGPHLIYLPENVLSMEQFCADVQRVFDRYGRCVVAASEGIRKDEKTTWTEIRQAELKAAAEKDPHGHGQLSGTGILGDFLADVITRHYKKIAPDTKMRIRADTFGYLQRCFPGAISQPDAQEARMVGQAAVQYALDGKDGSVVLQRADGPYKCTAGLEEDFTKIANHVKLVPLEFIGSDKASMTPAFLDYALPLVGDLPRIARLP